MTKRTESRTELLASGSVSDTAINQAGGITSELPVTPVLQRLYQSWLAQVNAAKVRFTYGAVASIPGGLVYGERSFVLFVRVEKRFAAACGSQRLMRGIE